MNNKKFFGALAEDIATKFLRKKGFIILERNYKNNLGEIDIVALEVKNPIQYLAPRKFFSSSKIIFVEVKAQTQNQFGQAEERINYFKQEKLKNLALLYLKEKRLTNHSFRIDAIRIDLSQTPAQIKHIISAVEED